MAGEKCPYCGKKLAELIEGRGVFKCPRCGQVVIIDKTKVMV